MSTFHRFTIGVLVAIFWLCALFSLSVHRAGDVARRVTPAAELEQPSDGNTTTGADSDRDSDEADGAVDLFGNDVSDAVARYSLDATGSLYEVHSPQTEIPRLGSPKS